MHLHNNCAVLHNSVPCKTTQRDAVSEKVFIRHAESPNRTPSVQVRFYNAENQYATDESCGEGGIRTQSRKTLKINIVQCSVFLEQAGKQVNRVQEG